MKCKEINLKLTGEEHSVLLDIFCQYVISYKDVITNPLRVNPNIGNTAEYRFIKDYIELFHGKYNYKDFFNKCAQERKKHIDWLFGSDNGGIPEFKLPTNYEEMKTFLYKYDMDYLGN